MSVYSSAALWSATTHIGVVTSMLLRNIIFARFLSSTDFAIALTFGVVLSLFEYISNFGHENLMQRSKSGNQEIFQATMQALMIARGLLVAIGIILIAPSIPSLLNLENVNFNYAWLAVVPAINGFAHLDHQRLHRRQIYAVSAKISLISDISSIFIALVCVAILDNYWAFYLSFLFRHSVCTFLSHAFARRRYSLAFDKQHVMSLMRFGTPLLAVGILKYMGTEADKAIVANIAGLDVFAIYILTLMLVVNGTNIINVALAKIFIRRLSVTQGSIADAVKSNGVIYCYLILPLILVLCMFGEGFIQLIFGRQYTSPPFLILVICAVVSIRSLNHWLNQTVISRASTNLMLIADVTRVLVAIAGVAFFYKAADVITIAIIFGFAELTYFACLSLLLHKRFPIMTTSLHILAIFFVFMLILSGMYSISSEKSWGLKLALTLPTLIVFYVIFLSFSKTCRRQTNALIRLIMNAKDSRFIN